MMRNKTLQEKLDAAATKVQVVFDNTPNEISGDNNE